MTTAVFETYEDEGGEYRWRLRARNGEIVAASGDGFENESGAEAAALRVGYLASEASVGEIEKAES